VELKNEEAEIMALKIGGSRVRIPAKNKYK
jgi:hypothetical protein